MIKALLLSVVLDASPAPPPLPPLPPMWPGPVASPQPQDVHLDWADPVGRLHDGELRYQPPLLEPWYPSVPDTLIRIAPPEPDDPLQWADPLGHPTTAAGPAGIGDDSSQISPLPDAGPVPFACPTLPAAANLRWVHERGPDFDLCYARPRGATKRPGAPPRFGLYHGLHPGFEPLSRQPVAEGTIDGRPVRWFQARDGGAHARETLFAPRSARYPWTVHLWIDAANADELSDTLRIVSQLPFE